MLGQELVQVFSRDENYAVTAWDKDDIDITNFPKLEEKIAELHPEIVINAAAYNAVDLCETDDTEYEKALLLNRDVPETLADLSKKYHFTLVHYSTDYVFDGALEENKAKTGCCGGGCCGASASGEVGYNESAVANPLSRYGASKYAGEQAVREHAQQYYVVRLSKLFGKPGSSVVAKKSFFEVMKGLVTTKDVVEAVDDEKSCFTYAPDLAQATKELVESEDPFGTYHLVNEGSATWYEAALALYQEAGISTSLAPVPSDRFPRPARRPKCSTLFNTKRPKLRHYTEALKEFLKES